MSETLSPRPRQLLYSPDCSRAVPSNTQLPVVKVPADRLHNPVIHAQSWFPQAAPGQPVTQPAHKTLVAQLLPQVAGYHPAVHPRSKAAPTSSIAQAVSYVPATLIPISQVMSHAPLPGPALLPSSPWRQPSPHLQAHAAPSISGTSVIIAKDISQPTLAKALGFADSPQSSPSLSRQAPAALALPHQTAPLQCHHTAVTMKVMEILPQVAAATTQAEQAGAQGVFTRKVPNGKPGVLSQSGLKRLVTQAEAAFANQPAKFDAFLHLVHEFQAHHINKQQLEEQVSALA